MKIVIDISRDRYDEIMAMDWKNCRLIFDEEIRAIHDGKAISQEPCDDCISRQAVLDLFNRSDEYSWEMSLLKRKIEKMPPVTPAEKVGKWTRELIRNEYGGCIGAKMICSECGQDNGYDKRMNFCPNCGAKMQEVEG